MPFVKFIFIFDYCVLSLFWEINYTKKQMWGGVERKTKQKEKQGLLNRRERDEKTTKRTDKP